MGGLVLFDVLGQVFVTELELRATDPTRQLDYSKYVTLLETAATQYDSSNAQLRGAHSGRSINHTDMYYEDYDSHSRYELQGRK